MSHRWFLARGDGMPGGGLRLRLSRGAPEPPPSRASREGPGLSGQGLPGPAHLQACLPPAGTPSHPARLRAVIGVKDAIAGFPCIDKKKNVASAPCSHSPPQLSPRALSWSLWKLRLRRLQMHLASPRGRGCSPARLAFPGLRSVGGSR